MGMLMLWRIQNTGTQCHRETVEKGETVYNKWYIHECSEYILSGTLHTNGHPPQKNVKLNDRGRFTEF